MMWSKDIDLADAGLSIAFLSPLLGVPLLALAVLGGVL